MTEAQKRYRRQHPARLVLIGIKILVGLAMFALSLTAFSRGEWSLGAFFGLLVVLLVWIRHLESWRTRRTFRKSPYCGEDLFLTFSETGFHARPPTQDASLQWSLFTKVVHFRDGFLLFRGPNVFNWIPVSALEDSAAVTELDALLRAKIAVHRVIEPVAVISATH